MSVIKNDAAAVRLGDAERQLYKAALDYARAVDRWRRTYRESTGSAVTEAALALTEVERLLRERAEEWVSLKRGDR